MKEQEAKGLLSDLGIKTPFCKISLWNILFSIQFYWVYKNEWSSKHFLLAGNKFMSGMHLKQPGFTYSACGPFTRNKERIQKFIQSGNTDFIYRNELDKACFQSDAAYGESKY